MGEVLDALLGFVGAIDIDAGIGVRDRTVLGVRSLSHFSVRFCRLERYRASARGIRSAHQILTRIEAGPATPACAATISPGNQAGARLENAYGKFISCLLLSPLSSLLVLLSCD